MSFFLVFIPLLLLGLFCLWIGLRGVRVDGHPLCRKCGFDLTGRPEGSDRCAECGADLTRPRAIRHGHRRRRPVALAFGLTMALSSLGFICLVGWSLARGFDPYQVAPTWYLLREARNQTGGPPVAAWQELRRRLGNGKLSKDQLATATEMAMSIQGDHSRTWHTAIGDFIDTAHKRSDLTNEQWARFARQAATIVVTLRPQIRRGDDDLPARIAVPSGRVGTNSHLRVRIDDPIVARGDLLMPPPPDFGSGYSSFGLDSSGGASTSRTFRLDHRAVAEAPLGSREAILHVKMSMRDDGHDTTAPVVEWEEVFRVPWHLVAADAETLKLIDDDTFRAAVEQGTQIKFLGIRSGGRSDYLGLDLQFRRIPVPLAHTVILRSPGGREWKFATITVARGDMNYSTGGMASGLTARTVDVIFRPDPKAARNTVDVTELWNREFVIKNVAVQRPAPPPPPPPPPPPLPPPTIKSSP